jgi:hypothetical protein
MMWTIVAPSAAFAASGILFGVAVPLILRLREGAISTKNPVETE